MVFRKRSLEEYDDDYKPLSKRMHSMYLKDGPINGEQILTDTNVYSVSTYTFLNVSWFASIFINVYLCGILNQICIFLLVRKYQLLINLKYLIIRY